MIDGINEEWLKKGHMKLIDFLRRLGKMSTITGKVKEIFMGEIASGRNAGDNFWSITLDNDEKLTCFPEAEKKGWIEGLEEGVEYTFTVKVSGDYVNIAGQTVPCVDSGGDMRDPEGGEEEFEDSEDRKVAKPLSKPRKVAGKPVKVAQKRKPPVVTSTMGGERVFKNRISALNSAVDFTIGVSTSSTEKEVIATAKAFEEYITTGG